MSDNIINKTDIHFIGEDNIPIPILYKFQTKARDPNHIKPLHDLVRTHYAIYLGDDNSFCKFTGILRHSFDGYKGRYYLKKVEKWSDQEIKAVDFHKNILFVQYLYYKWYDSDKAFSLKYGIPTMTLNLWRKKYNFKKEVIKGELVSSEIIYSDLPGVQKAIMYYREEIDKLENGKQTKASAVEIVKGNTAIMLFEEYRKLKSLQESGEFSYDQLKMVAGMIDILKKGHETFMEVLGKEELDKTITVTFDSALKKVRTVKKELK